MRCLCGACKNRTPEQRQRTRQVVRQVSSGRIPVGVLVGTRVQPIQAGQAAAPDGSSVPVVVGVPVTVRSVN